MSLSSHFFLPTRIHSSPNASTHSIRRVAKNSRFLIFFCSLWLYRFLLHIGLTSCPPPFFLLEIPTEAFRPPRGPRPDPHSGPFPRRVPTAPSGPLTPPKSGATVLFIFGHQPPLPGSRRSEDDERGGGKVPEILVRPELSRGNFPEGGRYLVFSRIPDDGWKG